MLKHAREAMDVITGVIRARTAIPVARGPNTISKLMVRSTLCILLALKTNWLGDCGNAYRTIGIFQVGVN